MTRATGRAWIGISGWLYRPWRGVFYPPGLKRARELAFASSAFDSIEINGSFYSLMRPETYQGWYEQTPAGFKFSVKGGRYITHMKRLRNIEPALANFFASGVLRLREKLGPILWQLPPTLAFDEARLRAFCELLPKDTEEAAHLAAKHDERLRGRAETRPLHSGPISHAIEVRHASFVDPRYIELLRRFSIASCVADTAGHFPMIEDATAPFAYVRLHGAERLYTSGYELPALREWAERARLWSLGSQTAGARFSTTAKREPRDVFVYFDNDVKVRAPFDAANLRRLLNGQPAAEVPRDLERVSEEPRTSWPVWEALARARN